MKVKPSYLSLIIILLIGGLIGFFIVSKASCTSFTHDESFSYLNFPQDSFMEIISFKNWFMNNHILNSLFMKYSEMLFGNSEIALRLPNLLLLFVYMMYCYRIFRQEGAILRIASFIILCTNIFIIDLFGLARGYGLSYGFMVMSLFHLISHVRTSNKVDLYLFHFSAMCAILSHFTLLTFYVSSLGIIILVKFLQTKSSETKRFHLFKSNKEHILPFLFNVIILYEPVRRAIKYGQLDVGGRTGFYSDSVSSFLSSIFYYVSFPLWVDIILKLLITLIVVVPLFIIVFKYYKGDYKYFKDQVAIVITTCLLTLIPAIIVTNHFILGSDYPIGRFLIFLIPLFWIHFSFLINLSPRPYKVFSLGLLFAIGLMSSITFVTKSNFNSYETWGYDAETKTMIQDLMAYKEANNINSDSISVGVNWLFEPTANYYRKTNQLEWLSPFDREGIGNNNHFVYTFKDAMPQLDSLNYEVIKEYDRSKTILLKKKGL